MNITSGMGPISIDPFKGKQGNKNSMDYQSLYAHKFDDFNAIP